jgi:tRNA G10  N-methylase Trm11
MAKNGYFASFPAGMQFIVKGILEEQISDIAIRQLFDGAVLFETEKAYDKLNTHCFNNIFSLITYAEKMNPDDIESFIRHIVNSKLHSDIIARNTKKFVTFRVIISSENQLIAIDNGLKTKLENFIASQSRLKINKRNPDAEFWVLYRREGFCFFLKRLSRHGAYDKILNRGELHPEAAYIMNWFAGTDKNDVVLDPFCGNGAIPLKRALHFPTKQIYAFDADKAMVNVVKKKIAEKTSLANMKNLAVKQADIRNLDIELASESVDKIVTDPPWGLYEDVEMDIDEFYSLALSKMDYVLKNDGIMVVLTSRHIGIESILKAFPHLALLHNYNVLVSGKKANIVKLKKINYSPTTMELSQAAL